MYVGAERLIPEALAAGAAGAVSGLASAYPEVVAEVVRRPDPEGADRLDALRRGSSGTRSRPRSSRCSGPGVPLSADVRAPLEPLGAERARAVDQLAAVPQAAAPPH